MKVSNGRAILEGVIYDETASEDNRESARSLDAELRHMQQTNPGCDLELGTLTVATIQGLSEGRELAAAQLNPEVPEPIHRIDCYSYKADGQSYYTMVCGLERRTDSPLAGYTTSIPANTTCEDCLAGSKVSNKLPIAIRNYEAGRFA